MVVLSSGIPRLLYWCLMEPEELKGIIDGKAWTQYSISIWSDIRKSQEEIALGHPAIFPVALVVRLIKIFTNEDDRVVLDPGWASFISRKKLS